MAGDRAPPETSPLGPLTAASCFGEAALRRYLTARVDKRPSALIDDLAGLVSTLLPDDDIALLDLTADH